MAAPWVKSTDGGARLAVRVSPRAKTSSVEGAHGGELKIRLAAPPVDGKANAELIRFLAAMLGIPRRDIALAHGETSRSKVVRVTGLTPDEVAERLGRRD